ncbi:cupredoxin domain-containing protein [Streptomyces sp. NPDC101175]|uniref:cupredoxin domain-containing protein n=1 Tax=Streptomyces sp. NPDC101175 TaxID=3366123 RepID=UPI00383269F3
MTRKAVIPFVALSVGIASTALTGCGTSSASAKTQSAPPAVVVTVKNIAFSPASVTVKVGQKVTWKFDDGGVPHDVVGDGGLKSALLTSGSYTHTFAKTGTYHYSCTVHASMMHGTVTVR